MTLPETSVSEQLAAAFSGMPSTLPVAVTSICDAVLTDVAGLCLAARHSDYVQAALRATSEPGPCTLIGHAGSFNIATAALCNGTAAHGEDYDDTFEGGPIHAGAVIIPAVLATAEHHVLKPRQRNQKQRREHVPQQQVDPEEGGVERAQSESSDQGAERSVGLQGVPRESVNRVGGGPPSGRIVPWSRVSFKTLDHIP